MKPILANRNISMTTKIRVIKTYVCCADPQLTHFVRQLHLDYLSERPTTANQQYIPNYIIIAFDWARFEADSDKTPSKPSKWPARQACD
ncbi:hypothetical protein PoB_001001000 [Plakobranchus ocellatus]|uniref:Uncharacterized protein n=1 Tax=Plakobranchus ocellatus TaxID=259542 RepID=A0AAV3YL86_9GAST|nr:hypothetical protein PoB_001001000 [Plakobranchus ocellatus]